MTSCNHDLMYSMISKTAHQPYTTGMPVASHRPRSQYSTAEYICATFSICAFICKFVFITETELSLGYQGH